MRKPDNPRDVELMTRIINGEQTNLYKWFDQVYEYFCEERAINEHTSIEEIRSHFYNGFHETFFYTLPIFSHKFLNDKDVGHIVEPRPLVNVPCITNLKYKLKYWEGLFEE